MKNLKKVMGGGHRSLKSSQKSAFTLAEVLITLAIIGVVAALTIPTVVAKYNQHAQYTAFMKMYNTLTNVISLAEGEFGNPNNWNFDLADRPKILKTYIYPYLKTSKICEDSDISNCFSDYEIKTISGGQMGASPDIFLGDEQTVLMQDGTTLGFITDSGEIDFVFDTNGSKGPNTFGRDIFFVVYASGNDGKWYWAASDLLDKLDLSSDTKEALQPSQCDPSNSEAMGLSCPERLLKEGKMDY